MGLSLTPLLETAISLIVVYFLFSNVISALTESVYALLQVRAGFLKHSIGNLLNEETDSLSKILWNNFKSRLPFGQLIEKIIIWIRKWLSNLSRNNKTVETVSKACGLFNAKQKLKEANEKLEEANKKFSETASEENRVAVLTAKALRDEAAKIVIPLENIVERVYENPIIKNSIKKLPSYISAGNFSKVLFDEVLYHKDLKAGDDIFEELKKEINDSQGILAGNKELKRILKNLVNTIDTAADNVNQNMSTKLKLLDDNVTKWFNDSMERASGRFKRLTSKYNFVIALLFTIVFNVDSIKILRYLWNSPDTRQQMIVMGEAIKNRPAPEVIPSSKGKPVSIGVTKSKESIEKKAVAKKETANSTSDTTHTKTNTPSNGDSATTLKSKLDTTPVAKKESDLSPLETAQKQYDTAMVQYAQLAATGIPVGRSFKFKPLHQLISKHNKSESKYTDFFHSIFSEGFLFSWFGWLITAFAMMFGAQFWFDALVRISSIRMAVPPKDDKKK